MVVRVRVRGFFFRFLFFPKGHFPRSSLPLHRRRRLLALAPVWSRRLGVGVTTLNGAWDKEVLGHAMSTAANVHENRTPDTVKRRIRSAAHLDQWCVRLQNSVVYGRVSPVSGPRANNVKRLKFA